MLRAYIISLRRHWIRYGIRPGAVNAAMRSLRWRH